MPKRPGKATSRRARHQPRRPLQHVTLPPPQSSAVPPVGTPDERESRSLDPPQRIEPAPSAMLGSSLSARDRASYHYVERDLRNIGILSLLMLLVLIAAWFAFTQLGLTS